MKHAILTKGVFILVLKIFVSRHKKSSNQEKNWIYFHYFLWKCTHTIILIKNYPLGNRFCGIIASLAMEIKICRMHDNVQRLRKHKQLKQQKWCKIMNQNLINKNENCDLVNMWQQHSYFLPRNWIWPKKLSKLRRVWDVCHYYEGKKPFSAHRLYCLF